MNIVNPLQFLAANNPFPLFGDEYGIDSYMHIDLSQDNCFIPKINSQNDLTKYIKNLKKDHNKILLYGGYEEKRNFYQSNLFKRNQETRNIHLAIDVWADIDTKLYAPIEGHVFSVAYNNKVLDYGNTLILKHHIESVTFYSLYGHLSKSITDLWRKGDYVARATIIGNIGNMEENGGWSPHVHCQLIIDMEGNKDDYKGVCSVSNQEKYLYNCPNPSILILPKN